MKKNYAKKDYDMVVGVVKAVQKLYLVHKATLFPDKPIDQLEITDDDLVPLVLFDDALSEREYGFKDRKRTLEALIEEGKMHVSKKIGAMGVENEKTKKIISNSIFVQYLNDRLETTHEGVFTYYYKLQLLYYHFITQGQSYFKPKDFMTTY